MACHPGPFPRTFHTCSLVSLPEVFVFGGHYRYAKHLWPDVEVLVNHLERLEGILFGPNTEGLIVPGKSPFQRCKFVLQLRTIASGQILQISK